MKKYYYHATDIKNVKAILRYGLLSSFNGYVYLADTPFDCLKFIWWNAAGEPEGKIAVFRVELDTTEVVETNTHNKDYFKCSTWMYKGDIKPELLTLDLNGLNMYSEEQCRKLEKEKGQYTVYSWENIFGRMQWVPRIECLK